MSYPAISLATATVGCHRCPQKRLQTARQPPVYTNSSPDHRACNSLTPAAVLTPSIPVHRWIRAKDPHFTEKLTDVVGLYLNPPDKAVVLCVDEKSQIQALQRTQPGLPMKKGRCGTMTHDYKRHGTTTLFAALNLLDGCVIGECMPRHRHQEFLRFLRRLDREFPEETPLHLVLDNYGTHTEPSVRAWLDKHPRFTLHFIPTSSSWLNLVERWFRELTEKRVRRGSFESVPELIAAIEQYLAASNADPKPFVWHTSAQAILDKLAKCKATYETLD